MAETKKQRSSVAGIAVSGGKVFTARRREGGDLGGKWEFPGGKVRQGETDEEALVREYGEELSVPVEVGSPVSQVPFEHRDTHFTLRAYRVKFLSGDFSFRQHSEYRWVTAEELEGLDFAESDKLLFSQVKLLLGGS
ncbi:MAG: (deoxy)nucleoside triphosphate pyrophosphohydrolase [Treponema sp.]|jgi:8-oxo-dGTP diphosphatase|nr:(deoxy)nucleoside triphosphate pyrophosphohydrolase [Treponema sp.]